MDEEGLRAKPAACDRCRSECTKLLVAQASVPLHTHPVASQGRAEQNCSPRPESRSLQEVSDKGFRVEAFRHGMAGGGELYQYLHSLPIQLGSAPLLLAARIGTSVHLS